MCPILYFIYAIIGSIGNGMVISHFGAKQLKTAVDVLVLNLAVADFVYCLR